MFAITFLKYLLTAYKHHAAGASSPASVGRNTDNHDIPFYRTTNAPVNGAALQRAYGGSEWRLPTHYPLGYLEARIQRQAAALAYLIAEEQRYLADPNVTVDRRASATEWRQHEERGLAQSLLDLLWGNGTWGFELTVQFSNRYTRHEGQIQAEASGARTMIMCYVPAHLRPRHG